MRWRGRSATTAAFGESPSRGRRPAVQAGKRSACGGGSGRTPSCRRAAVGGRRTAHQARRERPAGSPGAFGGVARCGAQRVGRRSGATALLGSAEPTRGDGSAAGGDHAERDGQVWMCEQTVRRNESDSHSSFAVQAQVDASPPGVSTTTVNGSTDLSCNHSERPLTAEGSY